MQKTLITGAALIAAALTVPLAAQTGTGTTSGQNQGSGSTTQSNQQNQQNRSATTGAGSGQTTSGQSTQGQQTTGSRSATTGQQGSQAGTAGQSGQQNQGQQQGIGGANLTATPLGWVRVAYDYDGDGQYDTVESIYAFDLEQARAASSRRAGGQGGTNESGRGFASRDQGAYDRTRSDFDDRGMSSYDRRDEFRSAYTDRMGERQGYGYGDYDRRGGMARLRGRITDMTTVTLAGSDEPHTFAKIQTSDGRTEHVDLGSQQDLQDLNLSTGDQIQLVGSHGTINDRDVIFARAVRSQDGLVAQIDRERSREGFRQVDGTVLATWTGTPEGVEGDHQIALVQLQNGRTVTVDLGSRQTVQSATLGQGKQIKLLATPTTLNGERALKAKQLYVDGRSIDLESSGSRATDRTATGQQNGTRDATRENRGRDAASVPND